MGDRRHQDDERGLPSAGRTGKRAISRRAFLRGTATLGGGTLISYLLAACGGASPA